MTAGVAGQGEGTVPLAPEVFAALRPTEQFRVARELAALLTAQHTTPVEEQRRVRVPVEDVAADNVAVRAAAERVLPEVLDDRRMALVREALTDLETRTHARTPAVLTCLDGGPTAVLWDAADRPGLRLADPARLRLADPAADLAQLFCLGEDLVHGVLTRYQAPWRDGLRERAWAYQQREAIDLLARHAEQGRPSAAIAWSTFTRVFGG